MRALTLKPHWAHAVAHLGKRVENRSTPIPPALIGQRIAIHAGATLPKGWPAELHAACPCRRELMIWVHEGVGAEVRAPGRYYMPVHTRAIVATAVLAGCDNSREEWDDRDAVGDEQGYFPPPLDVPEWADINAVFWWRLADVVTLAEPVAWGRGQLGLWTLPEDIAARVVTP